jgi:hypothetical protein
VLARPTGLDLVYYRINGRGQEALAGREHPIVPTKRDPVRTLLVIVSSLVISYGANAETYTISSYPAGLAEVPCDAFKRNPDGSWTQVAMLTAGGALIPAGNNFKNTAESRIIEKNCGKE